MTNRFRVNHCPCAESNVTSGGTGSSTNRAIEERSAETVKEPSVEAAALEFAHCARVAVRQDRLRPVCRCGNSAKPRGDLGDRIIPRDSLELRRTFWPDSSQWVRQSVRVIDA